MARHIRATHTTYCGLSAYGVHSTRLVMLATCSGCYKVYDLLRSIHPDMADWQIEATARILEMYRA